MKNKKQFFYKNKKEHFEENVVKFLYDKITKILNFKDNKINIALSGGNTPMPILKLLKDKNIDWDRINFFLVDERCVNVKNKQSNYRNLNEFFFRHISAKNFSMVQPNRTFIEGIKNYKNLILKTVPLSKKGFPEFDLILLGMGNDGHTASLFPKTLGLEEKHEWVILNHVPQQSTDRITITYPVILSAKEIVVIVKGEIKGKIVRTLNKNSSSKYPIQKIVDNFENLSWLVG